MAKAQQYISEYDAALASFNKAVEDYNKTLDAYEATFYQGGVMVGNEDSTYPGFDIGGGYFATNYPDFGMVGRKPTSITRAPAYFDENDQYVVKDPRNGTTYNLSNRSGIQVNENLVVTMSGHIMEFSPKPGDFTQTVPSFDMERYKSLLTEDFQAEQKTITDAFATEQKAIRDALAKTQAEEKAKFDAQKAEMERQAAITAAENAKAEEQARASFAQAQADAAAAQAERDTKTKQFKEETESMQRDIGARRAGYVRARRMRSRSLLSGA